MNEKGEIYIKDKNGKVKMAEVDQFGQPFVRNAKGEKVYLNKNAPPPSFNIQTNDKGEKFIIDKNGKQVLVKTDKDGNTYVIGDNG
jgi:hypothetical protein